MSLPKLGPPPMDNPVEQPDGRFSPPWVQWLRQLWDTMRDETAHVAVIASRSAAQSIPHNTITPIQWDGETVDTHNAFTTGASADFVAPFAGRYLVSSSIHYAVSGLTGYCELEVMLNGSLNRSLGLCAATGLGVTVCGSSVFDLAAGDSLKVAGYHNVTGGASRSTHPDPAYCWITIHRLGDT